MTYLLKKPKKHIDIKRKYKEEMEGDYNNASPLPKYKNKQLMAKVNFLNQAESSMSESYISQLHGNRHKKTRK